MEYCRCLCTVFVSNTQIDKTKLFLLMITSKVLSEKLAFENDFTRKLLVCVLHGAIIEEEEESLFNREYMVWETSIKTTYGRWHRGHPVVAGIEATQFTIVYGAIIVLTNILGHTFHSDLIHLLATKHVGRLTLTARGSTLDVRILRL